MEQGNEECGGLARSGLCLAGDVAPGERYGQSLGLNGRTLRKAGVADTLHQGRLETQGLEGGGAERRTGTLITH